MAHRLMGERFDLAYGATICDTPASIKRRIWAMELAWKSAFYDMGVDDTPASMVIVYTLERKGVHMRWMDICTDEQVARRSWSIGRALNTKDELMGLL